MEGHLRIALVLDRYEPSIGGLESWTEGLARWLVDRGHEVSIVASGGASSDPAIKLVKVEPSDSPLGLAASIARRTSRLKFDIVHDTGTGDRADVFQPQTGSRLVNSELDIAALAPLRRLRARLSPRLRDWRRQIAVLEQRQFADPSRVIAVSRMVRDQIAARYDLDASQIAVIHNGVDIGRFSPERLASRRDAARAKWSLHGGPVFLLVANNFHLKGVAIAIRAMARLRSSLPGAQLAVAGGGDAAPYIRLAKTLGLAGQITFLGRVARIEDVYAAADVAVQPTHYDACSLATLEGLACALPTLTTIANGAGELITSGVEGFVLQHAGDEEALAAAMVEFRDPALRGRMGLAARKLALSHDLNTNHRRIEAFYRQRLSLAVSADPLPAG